MAGRLPLRTLRLLAEAAFQHVVDDPALFVVQVSRRLPYRARVGVGVAAQQLGQRAHLASLTALGAMTRGHDAAAVAAIEGTRAGQRSRVAGEAAILLGRHDLAASVEHPATRARAAWMQGDLTGAVEILDAAGRGATRQARRLRSELELLSPGMKLDLAPQQGLASSAPADGEPWRVLHVLTNSLPHTQSGYSLRSHRILTTLAAQGHEVEAVTRTGYPVLVGLPLAQGTDTIEGIDYHRVLPPRLGATQRERLEQEAQAVLSLVRRQRPQVLHATTNYLNAIVTQAVSRATGIPWVYEVRGLMEQTWIAAQPTAESRSTATQSERARLVAAREAELTASADHVVTISAVMSDQLVSRSVPAEKITVVPNGVREELFEQNLTPQQAREELQLPAKLGIGPHDFLVGAASALVDYEGHDVLLRALALLLADETLPAEIRDRFQVVLVGEGVSRPRLETLAQELGIAERVHLPGRVPREDVATWVQALDVVAVPRLDRAVSRAVPPQKPVEAMALGRPVIVSDLPALLDAIDARDGVAVGIVLGADDPDALVTAMVRLARTPSSAAEACVSGRSVARRRTWPKVVRRYGAAYRNAYRARSEDALGDR